jgi:hypothetical protein
MKTISSSDLKIEQLKKQSRLASATTGKPLTTLQAFALRLPMR